MFSETFPSFDGKHVVKSFQEETNEKDQKMGMILYEGNELKDEHKFE